MNHYPLLLSLSIAIVGPLLALRYLRQILRQIIDLLCPAPGSSEFWWRSIMVLALTGSLSLTLLFGPHTDTLGWGDSLRRSLLLTTFSIFISVAFITSRIWDQISRWLHRQNFERAPAPRTESVRS
jgi:hypothetical protein